MSSAIYLLRFDDLCPTMDWRIWDQVETLLDKYSMQPILGIIPDNQDPELQVSGPNPQFWERARSWQNKRWIIGLHGYQHLYDSQAPSLIRLKEVSEFSGHAFEVQNEKIRAGLRIFSEHQLKAQVWIAPGHAFDETTLDVLKANAITIISDGFSYRHWIDRQGMTWIPQQFWNFRTMPMGVWTFCQHANAMTEHDIRIMEEFMKAHQDQFCPDFEELVSKAYPKSWKDTLMEQAYLVMRKLK
ncbi:DUF2334 domain-containing protein [Deltaproteobacteria bacterium TL4]